MKPTLLAVEFDHGGVDGYAGGLHIRKDFFESYARPEWPQPDGSHSVAAYAISASRDTKIGIRAQVAMEGAGQRRLEVRAIRPPHPPGPWLGFWLPHPATLWWHGYLAAPAVFNDYLAAYKAWAALVAAEGNLLGNLVPLEFEYADGEEAQWGLFEATDARLETRGVGRYEVEWQWQYRLDPLDQWQEFALTRHLIYTVLDTPTAPWGQDDATADTQLPWIDVLDVASSWAIGARSTSEAARRVCECVYALGTIGVLEYGCPISAMEMYAKSTPPWNHFDCTAFLNRLRGQLGNGRYVNCSDCATIVSTFANILGCDLWQSRMGEYLPHFEMSRILAIGTRKWDIPCGLWPGFSFHEVAWTDDCTEQDRVYDACLQVDVDYLPWEWPYTPYLPVNMRFGHAGEGWYRDKLTTPRGRSACTPRPWERRRRAVF